MATFEGNDEWKRQQALMQQMQQRTTPKAQGSYFPAANTQQNLMNQFQQTLRQANAAIQPSVGGGSAGFGPGRGLLPPEQNPAYQAALQRPRPATTQYTTPSRGTIGVPAGSRLPPGYAQAEGQRPGNISTPESRSAVNAAPPYTNYAADWAKGFGTPVYPKQPNQGSSYFTQNFLPSLANTAYAALTGGMGGNVQSAGSNAQPYMPATNAITQNNTAANFLASNPFIGPTPFNLRPPRRYFDDQNY